MRSQGAGENRMDAVVRFSILHGVRRSGSCRHLTLLPTRPPHSCPWRPQAELSRHSQPPGRLSLSPLPNPLYRYVGLSGHSSPGPPPPCLPRCLRLNPKGHRMCGGLFLNYSRTETSDIVGPPDCISENGILLSSLLAGLGLDLGCPRYY